MPRRRGPKEGTITARPKKGVYEAAIVIGYKDKEKKRPIRKYKNFELREDAVAWLNKQLGKPLNTSRATVKEWCEEFLQSCERRKLARSSIFNYRKALENDLTPHLGKMRLLDITPYHAKKWWEDNLIDKNGHHKYKTLQSVKACFNEASKLELIEDNPFRKLSAPRPKAKNTSRWSASDANKVVAFAKKTKDPLYPFLHVALTTGMRREELLGLKWCYVDTKKKCLKVEETVTYLKGSWSFGPPKTEASRRTVYFDSETAKMFELQRKNVEALKRETRYKHWQDHDLVFPSSLGTPVSESRFRLAFKKLIKDAGVQNIRLYDTRSTYVSLSDGKVSDAVGAARAGHSIKVRRDVYKRSAEDEEKAAALSLKELTAGNRR